jgi:hypothetical protein
MYLLRIEKQLQPDFERIEWFKTELYHTVECVPQRREETRREKKGREGKNWKEMTRIEKMRYMR